MIKQDIDNEIMAKTRITADDVNEAIAEEWYFTAWQGAQLAHWSPDGAGALHNAPEPNRDGPLARLTICVLALKNGFTVTGESACASPENFDAEAGRRIAREKAFQKVWPLLGFLLCELRACTADANEAEGASHD